MAFLTRLRRNPFRKKFRKIFINLLAAFLGLQRLGEPSWCHLFPIAAAFVKKLFQKAANKF
jgi:hypothetical protein